MLVGEKRCLTYVDHVIAGLSVHSRGGLMLEERYNVSALARFTRVASLEHCLQQCDYRLDSSVFLRPTLLEPLIRGWKNFQYRNVSSFLFRLLIPESSLPQLSHAEPFHDLLSLL